MTISTYGRARQEQSVNTVEDSMQHSGARAAFGKDGKADKTITEVDKPAMDVINGL